MKRPLLLFLVATAIPVLADRPLVDDRIMFNWHNFLSGCSTWNLADWNRWTDDARKLGYNAIMVHAYGNNPMVSFMFNGKSKPVGYLSTTAKGRDWSTLHVNDVRRLSGGWVFDKPVFGADVAQMPENRRVEATRSLMQAVFAHAGERGMNVFFANDVDTGSANPQELILALPQSARFAIQTKAGGMTGVSGEGTRKFWLADPDTAEGYEYYKAQAAALMTDYPQITCLVLWFRRGGTPWMDCKRSEMPAAWQEEYKAAVERKPGVEKYWHSQHLFAIAKIARAYQRALNETGHDRVRLAVGTWNFAFLPAADLFLPNGVTLIGLDYDVLHGESALGTAAKRQSLAEVGAHRPLIPVIWAHHDDGAYIGRPFTPFDNFLQKLEDAKAGGFGVMHWMTRPLDLYFASHIRQVFETTRNEPLRATCDRVGGPGMGEYLYRWITEAPQFGRETTDYFIDRALTNAPGVVAGCRERLKLLDGATGEQAEYHRGMEQFIAAFHEAQDLFQRSQAALAKNDVERARQLMLQCRPEPVIEQFAKFSVIGGMTRGEQGLLVSLNLRWLTHIISHRQALGLEPVRIKFGPTQHDQLAQYRGTFTFHLDDGHKIWEVWGREETGARVFTNPDAREELARTGIEIDKLMGFTLHPIMAVDSRDRSRSALLPAGEYCLRLFLDGACDVRVGGKVHHADRQDWSCPVVMDKPGWLDVTLVPLSGTIRVCGAVLEGEH